MIFTKILTIICNPNKIKNETIRISINREEAEISALSSGKI